jgi:hypothetical protein
MSMGHDVSFVLFSQPFTAVIRSFLVRAHSVGDVGVGVGTCGVGADGVAENTTPVSFHVPYSTFQNNTHKS